MHLRRPERNERCGFRWVGEPSWSARRKRVTTPDGNQVGIRGTGEMVGVRSGDLRVIAGCESSTGADPAVASLAWCTHTLCQSLFIIFRELRCCQTTAEQAAKQRETSPQI